LALYKTVLIIFPLNLQTITITLDVVKWRCGEEGRGITIYTNTENALTRMHSNTVANVH